MGFNEPITLLGIAGFNARFDEVVSQHPSYEKAWEAVEQEVVEKYNHRKYKNYTSFKQSRCRWLRKRKSNRWNAKPGFGRAA